MSPPLVGGDAPWPTPHPDQTRVLLLGTYHMDNPGLDEVNVDADDVLADDRQAELRDLADRLCEWDPDRVAVERPRDRNETVTRRYREYRDGERAYDREESFDPAHPIREDRDAACRSEVVQVGYRVADRQGHASVAAVDDRPDRDRYEPDPLGDRDVDSARKTDVAVRDPERHERVTAERLAASTIPEYLAWLNQPEQLSFNHELMFDAGVRASDDAFGSPTALAFWYERNVRMVHHLWDAMAADDDRVFLLVGSGHVRVLRHLLAEAPMFCPVSPRDLLPDPA